MKGVTYQIARELAGEKVYVATSDEGVAFYGQGGELLIEHPWPAPGTKHVSNGRPRGSGASRPEDIRDVIRSTGTGTPPGEYHRTVRPDGRVSIRNVVYGLGQKHVGRRVHAVVDVETVAFCDADTGEIIAEHPIPDPGTKHVGYRRYARKLPTFEPSGPDPELSPMS